MASHITNGTREKNILKKIECADENFANKAYREVIRQKEVLKEILGTIPVKQAQIYWETKNSSIHICLLRDFYEENLMADLQRANVNKKVIREMMAENYLSQLILILEKCHKKNVFHRSLKPSNVVKNLKTKNLFLVDFEVEGTTQYNIYKVWQPPELGMSLEEPPDKEKIDVWGIGAVMLSVVSSIIVEIGTDFEKLLLKIKDSQPLDELYENLQRKYSKELIDIIKNMLHLNPKKRPTIKDLKTHPFLEESLKLNDAETIQKNAAKSERGTFFQANIGEGIEAIYDYLTEYIDWDERVTLCLIKLNKRFIYQNRLHLKTEEKKLLLAAMKNNYRTEKVLLYGFQLLQKLISKSSVDDYLFSCDAVLAVIAVIKVMPKYASVKLDLYEFLNFLALSDLAAQCFGSHGGLQVLIRMMKEDEDDEFLLEKSCQALWGFCIEVCNAKIAAYEEVPAYICSCLRKHSNKRQLSEELIAVVFSLTAVPNVINVYCKHNIIYLITAFLKKNANNPGITALCCNTFKSFLINATFYDDVMGQFRKNCILDLLVSIVWNNLEKPNIIRSCLETLESIILDDEEGIYGFLFTKLRDTKKQSGMILIRKILNVHKTNAVVTQYVCEFLEVLVKFDEGCYNAKTYNIPNWLLDIKKTFHEDQELQTICNKIIHRLSEVNNNT